MFPSRAWEQARATAAWLFVGLICLLGSPLWAAEEDPNEAQIQLVIAFLGEPDRETRAVGLQFIREELPGEAATKRFAALLPDLSAEAQVDLLDALGDRQDASARPAVLEMLASQEVAVRAASLRALGGLGGEADVPLLAGKTAADSEPEKLAARQSLVRMRGDGVNGAVVAAMAEAEPAVRIELLGVLAIRNARETLPSVLESVKDSEASVRLAALSAVRYLAEEKDAAVIVDILKAAEGDAEKRGAELAMLAVASRGREDSAEPIIAGLAEADVASRLVLLGGLARAGGPKALSAIVARLSDDEEAVRDQAVRMLSIWPDPAVTPHLLEIVKTDESLRHQVLAIRGLVRLAGPQDDQPADLERLTEAMSLAKRPEEKRLVLGVLGGVGTLPALDLATSAPDDTALADEAGLAAVMIAETMKEGDKDQIRAAMEKVEKTVKNQQIRQRAEKVLSSL
ncbi:MAG: HEAT repeat domain-containing protein [Planctomycetota bacterium]